MRRTGQLMELISGRGSVEFTRQGSMQGLPVGGDDEEVRAITAAGDRGANEAMGGAERGLERGVQWGRGEADAAADMV